MKRLALTASLAALALPASAMAAATTTQGTVLSVNSSRHTMQVVDSSHLVHAYRFHGKIAKLHPGSVISFHQNGKTISAIRAAGSSHTVSYYAHVVRSSGKHLVLRLADGQTIKFSATQVAKAKHAHAHAALAQASGSVSASASDLTINIQGLAAGATVLVTETVTADGSITISITLPAPGSGAPAPIGSGSSGSGSGTGSGSGSAATETTVNGVVSDVEDDSFTVQTNDNSTLVFHMDADDLADIDMYPCDTVQVTYHVDAGLLIADDVNDNGTSDAGACGDDSSSDSSDEIGPITKISDSSVTIDTSDQGSMTFVVDPDSGLTDGFVLGDVVDVSYSTDDSGVNDADDIEYSENDSTGVVSTVSDGMVTMVDDSTGQNDVFTADPSEQMFEGVDVGDDIDVTWHQSGAQEVVDNVDDLTLDAQGGN